MTAHDCFGLQPDVSLRIAVVDLGGKTLLIWDRIDSGTSDTEKAANVQAFEAMLRTIRFSNRPAQTPPPAPTGASAPEGFRSNLDLRRRPLT